MVCEARDAGCFLASIAKTHCKTTEKLAFIAGGETVVHLTGNGKGGRNQELALSAASYISNLPNVAIASVGSDGTDGPTDAAGGYVDSDTYKALEDNGINIYDVLQDNDAYNALKVTDGLIMTGATGTNVNDVAIVLIDT
ncbi:MOFRL family protein [Pseudobutyrivibrio sp. YE44]|uniref:MOFRL family protein n=1 Tax=Pseudobutyrivibrio sp. YE44 TaxID=1520802 RepID=UPI000883165F|nr:MOFRL family protein [Pseudobutyrivibrio sp. YE44]SDB23814.1 MOFRL family protein [Pseudobutyrivibrio sp. YE44]